MECKDSRVGAVEVSPQCCQKKTATSVFALLLCVTASFNEQPFGSCKNYTASLLFNASWAWDPGEVWEFIFFPLKNTCMSTTNLPLWEAENKHTLSFLGSFHKRISKLSRLCSWKSCRRSKLPGTFVREVLKYRKSAVRGYIMYRYGIKFTQLKMNVLSWMNASWSVVNLTFTCNSRQNTTFFCEARTKRFIRKKSPSLCTHLHISFNAVGAHMTRVFGEEAAAVELHACGVVRVMLRLWCVDGPHSGSVLTLPERFNWSGKVLSGWIIQLCPAEGIGMEGGGQ